MFNWDCGNEGLIFTEEGNVAVGLSGEERREWIIPPHWNDGHWHTFFVEASCNAMFGNGMFGNADPHKIQPPLADRFNKIQPPHADRFFQLVSADLVWPNTEARALKMDFASIAEAANEFPEDSWQKHKAIEVGNAIMDNFDVTDLSSITRCREIAKEFLGNNVDSADVFKSAEESLVFGVGHCHIDTAWLWPYAETRRKIGRSWASQLDLIERYPEYNFVCSQAIQYQWLKEDYPELFERLKVQVKAGRFIPIGGSWVESDTNLPSGEAIARQFLYGQRFFEANFGIRCRTFWLPDTFGYSAQIPQLCRGAEMDSFLTQKLSWNNINKFPNTTFNWVALDGSQVLCHMPPSDTYNSKGTIKEIKKTVSNHRNLGIDRTGLLLFGFGDGGGGPTVEMLERLRRARGISDTVGHLPGVQMGDSVQSYFDKLLKSTDNGKKLVSWVGELYFEYHRGTYTTQANTKKGNRDGEVLLHDLEYLATAVSALVPSFKYPKKELDHLWELLLLNQFHDVLPGSSIEMVYEDAEEYYELIQKTGLELFSAAASAAGLSIESTGNELAAINTLPWGRSELVAVPAGSTYVSVQKVDSGKSLVRVSSEGSGLMTIEAVASVADGASAKEVEPGVFILENSKLKATVVGGTITSLVDKDENREIISEGGKGNQFAVFDDQPLFWQGWDTEVYSLNKKKIVKDGKVTIVESGPLRASLLVEQEISKDSWIKTTISLDAFVKPTTADVPAISYLEFNSEVEWREACKFLKVEFPVDVHSDYATYDSMYGSVKRPTHYNTFWDVAKFEVCCHKFSDLSDHTYGVSVLNTSKYGFATHGNTMRLSLLRSSKAPDGNADMGRHHIRYAILGHVGGLNSDVVRVAQNFNHPLRLLPVSAAASKSLPSLQPLVEFQGSKNVILSAVKRAEDDADVSRGILPTKNKGKSIVVRLYDSLGGKSIGSIVSNLPIKKAFKTNLLEEDKEEISVTNEHGKTIMPVTLRAFEIATYRLELA